MTPDDKLAAILAAVQVDPGGRGLARDPADNLFTATAGDFQAACRVLAKKAVANILTGFYIPTAEPPAFETDGPLGAVFLVRALSWAGGHGSDIGFELPVFRAIRAGLAAVKHTEPLTRWLSPHLICIERAGPATDGNYYTMRGRDIGSHLDPWSKASLGRLLPNDVSIGIGDGGNEIGMGKVPHETIVKNIPNGDLVHCQVPTDHLIVAGVSNWGAYALAAGVFVLRGRKPPADLFDPDRELEILEVMVREGPLVDGVTGRQTATVDGLTWDEYARPLVRIREILEAP
ncbi:MAG TPA: glutamate cyclase domain-containing protein [Urbifossiella sp.]|nr:glutamate cyclase domain-containing protein [Urbifossiella sp.]